MLTELSVEEMREIDGGDGDGDWLKGALAIAIGLAGLILGVKAAGGEI